MHKRSIRTWQIVTLAAFMVLTALFFLPLPDSAFHSANRDSTLILDRNETLLYELRHPDAGSQIAIPLAQTPNSCVDGLIAIEDRTFFRHPGVSARGVVRAAWQNLTAGRIVSGGSTLTQQLVSTLRGSKSHTLFGKFTEAFLALKLEQKWSKSQILERYLNSAYFGHRAYGMEAAAKTYFGKSAAELSVAECALLAGLPQSPSRLDPFTHFPQAKERQKLVLAAMQETGVLSVQEANDAFAEPLTLAEDRTDIRAPHFVMQLLDTHPEIADAPSVRTTLNITLQQEVERIVDRRLKDLAEKNVTSAAVVVLDAHTGDILSMVGSADYFDAEHDGAVNVTLAARQPGSALKPFTYALALTQGATAATTVADTEVQFQTQEGTPYTPRNYDYREHGLVRYREALANSYNIAAVRVAERVGIAALLGFLRNAGITTLTRSPEFYGLALTLGSGEVKLLELTQAYGIFPRGGFTLPIRMLADEPVQSGKSVLDPKVAWLITDILSDDSARLPEFGDEGPLNFDRPVAAKTGTTRNSRDNWTLGFTPDRIVGVWVGNADNSPMHDTSGVTGAGPIFHDVMEAAMQNLPPKEFFKPEGIIEKNVCALSGLLPSPLCPHTIQEHFIVGTEPTTQDEIYRLFPIDRRNSLLANKSCDQTFVGQKAFAVFPKEVEKWARENGWPTPPTRESPLCTRLSPIPDTPIPHPSSWIEILSPRDGASYALDPLIPDSSELIPLSAHASVEIRTIDWFVDGKKLGAAKAPDFLLKWKPTLGSHTIEARSGTFLDKRNVTVVQ